MNNIYLISEKVEINNYKKYDFSTIIDGNQKFDERITFIIFDVEKLINFLLAIIKKYYRHQIFIILLTKKKKKRLKLIIESKIKRFTEYRKAYFDNNNIFIYNDSIKGYKKIPNTILKIYCYFNQLGYRFLKQISLTNKAIQLKKEIKQDYTHYFNILLLGISGSGKNTFINTLFGEKKAYASGGKLFGTFKYNYYVHNSYPIRIIDSSSFEEEMEAYTKLQMIYNKNSENIILDDSINDIFKFNNDGRNNIHLLLYFNIYNLRYDDIFRGYYSFLNKVIERNIPIIFIINKCDSSIFEDEDEKEDLEWQIKKAREGTNFENFETYFINSIKKEGIDILLNGIYKRFKNYRIEDYLLYKFKNNSTLNSSDLHQIKDSFFLYNINPYDILEESLKKSVLDIKKLMIKFAEYYCGEFKLSDYINFYFKNIFSLLAELVKKIYSYFEEEQSLEDTKEFIKLKLCQYFNIDFPILNEEKEIKIIYLNLMSKDLNLILLS